MPDDSQAQSTSASPAQVLAGAPQQQPQQPQQAPPQQAQDARHSAIGRAASFLFGHERDVNTGEPVPQKPGQMFRNLLAGALLGGAMGAQDRPTSSVGGFLSGFARGGNAVQQQIYQRQQAAQEQQMKQRQMSLEENKLAEEQARDKAEMERWNLQSIAQARDTEFKNREQLLREQEQEDNVQEWAIESGATLAPIKGNGEPGNGQDMQALMIKNPAAFQAPNGHGRLLVKSYSTEGLNYNAKDGWTNKDGKPVDWNNQLTWKVYFVPTASATAPISMSAKEWRELYGVSFPEGTDDTKIFNVRSIAPLLTVANQKRKSDHEANTADFKAKHDALNATVSSARTNVSQWESEKRADQAR